MQTTVNPETSLVKHLLRRFALGASEAEVEYYGQGGYRAAVERLLNSDKHEEPVAPPDSLLKNKDGNVIQNPAAAQLIWYAEQLVTNRPLTYKMALFWHDHFATSAQKVASGPCMLNHLRMLRDHALGSFPDLLLSVSRDPAMLYWLDNQDNIAGRPNENFAREVMELFTLGEGNYSEKDIQEAARAFTGWTYGFRRGNRVVPSRGQVPRQNSEYLMDIRSHDSGEKEVLGNRGTWEGEDVIKILVANPRSSIFITQKIWEWFVYPNPDKATIETHAKTFRESGHDIRALLRSIMLSREFQSDRARRSIVKNPYDFCIPMVRQLGLQISMVDAIRELSDEPDPGVARRAVGPAALVKRATATMGMELMFPPDVAGWPSGVEWISTSTMVNRIQWGQSLFLSPGGTAPNSYPALQVFGGGTVEDLVDKVLSVFDAEIGSQKRASLIESAKAAAPTLNRRSANMACGAVTKLLCSTPEFQFN